MLSLEYCWGGSEWGLLGWEALVLKLQKGLTNSDILIICCALTDQTRHIINKDVMFALGKEGVIINVGRGALIDEKELVRCLVQGEMRGAGLDVFENKPDVPK
ncbi:hypothetical protein HHK36_001057 [Tetracentron sinense]|uniref:D-isomer specific 2-hydroxyacid dehydrogenase NAD-binding domain-containing protein n=1 Tax=Tetracentron sinense TaxID=13715 RepID=A0A834ZTA5_TETSI|nr:hypothetical protein HHK36_001057 [Tetracentron sinense]